MSNFINPVEEDRCVFLSYEGEMSPIELAAARYEADGLLRTNHWTRIVVDATQLRSVPIWPELCDFARELASEVPRGTRVAMVVRPDQVQRARLVEKLARNQGVFLTYFLDAERATAWVKQTNSRPGRLDGETKAFA